MPVLSDESHKSATGWNTDRPGFHQTMTGHQHHVLVLVLHIERAAVGANDLGNRVDDLAHLFRGRCQLRDFFLKTVEFKQDVGLWHARYSCREKSTQL